jgi:hypothetical protein
MQFALTRGCKRTKATLTLTLLDRNYRFRSPIWSEADARQSYPA